MNRMPGRLMGAAPDGTVWMGTASEAVAVITLDPSPASVLVYLPLVVLPD